jgi:hypothetical protein
MVCEINIARPCSSASRAKNRYTRKEVKQISEDCSFKKVKGVAMDDLCQAIITRMKTKLQKTPIKYASPQIKNVLKNIKNIDTKPFGDIKDTQKITKVNLEKHKQKVLTPPKPKQIINLQPIDHYDPKQLMFNKFKEYFRDDLLGFIDKINPKFRVATAGGYGLKTLMETKHNIYGKVKTGDVDFTVSTYRATMSPLQCYQHWNIKLHKFFNEQPKPSDFQVKVINFNHSYVPIMNFHRDYVFMITYKNDEFIDVAITNQRIKVEMIDVKTSLKAGIPIKNEEYYLKEFLSLIYMENVRGVNDFCYAKRNPVTGAYSCKGIKDIDRAKLICTVKQSKKYYRFCKLLENVTIQHLKTMSESKRDAIFADLHNIVTPKKV